MGFFARDSDPTSHEILWHMIRLIYVAIFLNLDAGKAKVHD